MTKIVNIYYNYAGDIPDGQTSCFWYLREGLLLSDFFLIHSF